MTAADELMAKMGAIQSEISECEGLIAAKLDGTLIIGSTISEVDHNNICATIAGILETSLGEDVGKGSIGAMMLTLNEGYVIVVKSDEMFIVGLLGLDGRTSTSLLQREMKALL